MKIFITGHHRAGTHTAAEQIAKDRGLHYVEEMEFGLQNKEAFNLICQNKRLIHDKNAKPHIVDYPEMKRGAVIQCPFLAHRTLELAEKGKVYWCRRKLEDVSLSMAKNGFDVFMWDIMKAFNTEFPNDPIWNKLKYEGKDDRKTGFAGYAALLWQVKEYFYKTKFSGVAEILDLEVQPYYDIKKTGAFAAPIKPTQKAFIEKAKRDNESICLC
jgi:hypothetical protein